MAVCADAQDVQTEVSSENDQDGDAVDVSADSGNSDTDEGWKPLTTLINENRILYRYDENEKTLYFKCTEPMAIPDYNYGNRTDWFADLGSEKKVTKRVKIIVK